MADNPRPEGYAKVMGLSRVLRVKKQHIRVIYGIYEDTKSVFIVDVRRRNEATYKNIPTEALSAAVTEAIATLKAKPRIC